MDGNDDCHFEIAGETEGLTAAEERRTVVERTQNRRKSPERREDRGDGREFVRKGTGGISKYLNLIHLGHVDLILMFYHSVDLKLKWTFEWIWN